MPDDFGQDFDPPRGGHIEAQLAAILDEVRRLHGAFPRTEDGECDLEGHRRYHEAMIEAAREQAKFWRELRLDLAKKGLYAVIVFALLLMFAGALAKLGLATVLTPPAAVGKP